MSGQGRREVTDLLRRHGLRAKQRLGQHFLADPNIVAKIIRVSGVGPGDRVIEIGPGTGTLTGALVSTGAAVVAIEIDTDLEPVLAEVLTGSGVDLRFADAASIDLGAVLGDGPWTMVANLPYNAGTGILLDALRHTPAIVRFVVMVQREVADRLLAAPGSRNYGLPSVVVGLHGTGRVEFPVSPTVFVPAPEVDSVVISVDRVPSPPGAERAVEIAAAAFGQRRKMVRRSLATVLEEPEEVLRSAEVDPTRRAEDLSPADFLAIAEAAP